MSHVRIIDGPLAAEQALSQVAAPEFGAVVTFYGNVRDNSRGKRVRFLEYDAYRPMAEKELAAVADEAEARWTVRCAILHRLGRVEIGQTSVVIAVASPHRVDAFEAGRWLMDAIKERVPIWKKEFYEVDHPTPYRGEVRAGWVEGSDVVPSTDD